MRNFNSEDAGLGVLVPAELSQTINRWRARYDPYLNMISPHITIAYPPFVPPSHWQIVRPAVQALLCEFHPFEIELRNTGVFLLPACVLWLEPLDGGILSRIHIALQNQIPDYVPEDELPFIPHVTLGFFENESSLREAQKAVETELEPMRFTVREICYSALDKWDQPDCIPLIVKKYKV